MPRVDLSVQQMDFNVGLTPTTTAGDATENHSFTNTAADIFLYVNNAGGSAITVTAVTPQTITSANLTVEDRAYTVAAGAIMFIGPFPSATFNQTDDKVHIDLSADTSVTVAAIQHGSNS